MTKKDYILIGSAVKEARRKTEALMGLDDNKGKINVLILVDELIKVFEEDNPRFDSDKFTEFVSKC